MLRPDRKRVEEVRGRLGSPHLGDDAEDVDALGKLLNGPLDQHNGPVDEGKRLRNDGIAEVVCGKA
jgi:hypothetical protein